MNYFMLDLNLEYSIKYMKDKESYINRFVAEYYQLYVRVIKLSRTIESIKEGRASFKPNCSIWLLEKQLKTMEEYLNYLAVRAKIEDIDLDKEVIKMIDEYHTSN